MPRLNRYGNVCMGVGGGQVSMDGGVVATGGAACWWTDTHVLFNWWTGAKWTLGCWNAADGQVSELGGATGCNELAAGGNRYAAWQAGRGVYGDINNPDAGLSLCDNDGRGGAADDGTVAIVPVRANGTGLVLVAADGTSVSLPSHVIARQVHVVSRTQAVWRTDAGTIHTWNLPPTVQVGGAYGPRWVEVPGRAPWIVYWSTAIGLVAHPIDSTVGVIVAPGQGQFYHDARLINGQLRVVYSTGAAEMPHELVTVPDAFLLTWHDLAQTPTDPIVAINKPCWCGWFEFNGPPPQPPPGNAIVAIRYPTESATIRDLRGVQCAAWVDGATTSGVTVDSIEAAAAASAYPPVAYWDGRHWPRWPQLPAKSWLGLQAYCSAQESPAAFETDMRRIIASVPAHNAIALICQCYTSNTTLTTNLRGIVPVFARLARDYPAITMLLPFSDHGRATGLCDHPEVLPLWQELAAGITGTPAIDGGGSMTNGIDEHGVLVDPEAYWRAEIVAGEDVRRYREVYTRKADLFYKYGIGSQNRSSCEPSSRLFMPHAGCPNVAPDPNSPREMCLGVKQVPEAWLSTIDTVENIPGSDPPVPQAWHWHNAAGPAYQPIPAPDVNPPDPSTIFLQFQTYQTTVRRSDPKGLTLYWDADSPHNIDWFEAQLLGAPEIFRLRIEPPFPPDGRYFRGLAWKPTLDGTFTPRLRVRDVAGNEAVIEGVPVTVTS